MVTSGAPGKARLRLSPSARLKLGTSETTMSGLAFPPELFEHAHLLAVKQADHHVHAGRKLRRAPSVQPFFSIRL